MVEMVRVPLVVTASAHAVHNRHHCLLWLLLPTYGARLDNFTWASRHDFFLAHGHEELSHTMESKQDNGVKCPLCRVAWATMQQSGERYCDMEGCPEETQLSHLTQPWREGGGDLVCARCCHAEWEAIGFDPRTMLRGHEKN